MAFCKTARFFFTLGLDLRGEGKDEEIDTLINSLEFWGITHFTNSPRSLSSESRSSSLSRLSSKRSGLSQVSNPSSLCSRSKHTQVIWTKLCALISKKILGVCTPPKDKVKVATIAKLTTSLYISKINNFVVHLGDYTIIQKGMIQFFSVPRTSTYPTGLCMALQGHIAEVPELLLRDKKW